MTKILPCGCESEYQDKIYGRKLRLHNETRKKPSADGGWACTVCGKIKSK
jgi:hypothetical protein